MCCRRSNGSFCCIIRGEAGGEPGGAGKQLASGEDGSAGWPSPQHAHQTLNKLHDFVIDRGRKCKEGRFFLSTPGFKRGGERRRLHSRLGYCRSRWGNRENKRCGPSSMSKTFPSGGFKALLGSGQKPLHSSPPALDSCRAQALQNNQQLHSLFRFKSSSSLRRTERLWQQQQKKKKSCRRDRISRIQSSAKIQNKQDFWSVFSQLYYLWGELHPTLCRHHRCKHTQRCLTNTERPHHGSHNSTKCLCERPSWSVQMRT